MFRALVLLPPARRALITEVNLKGRKEKQNETKKKKDKNPELLRDRVSGDAEGDEWPPDWLQPKQVKLELLRSTDDSSCTRMQVRQWPRSPVFGLCSGETQQAQGGKVSANPGEKDKLYVLIYKNTHKL